jgi:hypothetical protein
MLLVIAIATSLWLSTIVLVVSLCVTARRADLASYSPRRHSTCGTVRSRILTSVQSDQFATYR